MKSPSRTRKISVEFLLSMIAGAFVLVNGVVWLVLTGLSSFWFWLSLPFLALSSMAIVFAIVIFIGALIIYRYGHKPTGGLIVLIVSVFSMGTGGGFLLGTLLGIAGGALALQRSRNSQ